MRISITMAAALWGALVGTAAAADEVAPTVQMEEVVVTGSKLPVTAGNVTQKIDILRATDFDALVNTNGNLAGLLSYTPGNYASVLSRNDANWGSASGMAHTYKGYLLDGLPIDAFIDLQSLDPWAFARIEEQRGAAAVLYPTYLAMDFAGNQSPLAGPANFVLRQQVDQPRTRAATYCGSYNTVGTRFYRQQAAGNFHWFAGGHYEDSDYTNYGSPGSWLQMIDNPGYQKTKVYAHGTYLMDGRSDHRLSVYAHRTWHRGDAGRPYRGFDNTYTTLNSHYLRPLAHGAMAQFRVGYRGYDRSWEEDNYPVSILLRSRNGARQEIVPTDLSLSIPHGSNDVLTLGTDYQVAWYETYDYTDQYHPGNDARAMHVGAYAQEEQTWRDWVFRLGGRANHIRHDIDRLQGAAPGDDQASWNKALVSAGARWNRHRQLSVFANVGTSFRAPSLKSVGGTIPLADRGKDGINGQLPNPDLKPESGLSLDAGAEYQPQPGLYLGARGFLLRITDQISTAVVTASGSQSQDINAGETRTLGLELEVRHEPLSWARWQANYTLTQAEVTSNPDPDRDGAHLSFVPRHVANLGGQLDLPGRVGLSAHLQACSGIRQNVSRANPGRLDGWSLVTARLEKNFADRDGRQVQVYLEPYNLTDNHFDMAWGFRDPGLSTTGGISVSF